MQPCAFSQDQSPIQAKLTQFIKKLYNEDESIKVSFGNIPAHLQGKANVMNISFARLPDAKGEGLCLVELEKQNNHGKNVYVPFRVIKSATVFALTENRKKGDIIKRDLIAPRNTTLREKGTIYPSRYGDIEGKVLKKDIAAGTIITYQMIDAPVLIQKGETVNIVAENGKLIVQTKGRALEKGKMGDSIRVKNTTSDREILGKVVDGSTVSVSF
jgi:flagella basal body P-ring formation protein FlgA